jgi:hypothetical protein
MVRTSVQTPYSQPTEVATSKSERDNMAGKVLFQMERYNPSRIDFYREIGRLLHHIYVKV